MGNNETLKEILKNVNKYLAENGRDDLEIDKILLRESSSKEVNIRAAVNCYIDPRTGEIVC